MTLYKRNCRWCGEEYTAKSPDSLFCGRAHKKAFHNMRMTEGAKMWDLVMLARNDREAAAAHNLSWTTICRYAMHRRDQLQRQGCGRPWRPLRTVLDDVGPTLRAITGRI